jgi:hypothetical protein
MKGFIGLTQSDKEDILKQHSETYNGYSVGNVPSNMYPITTFNDARDTNGITVDMNGNVKSYTNHKINEIAAKNLHYDEIDSAYEFDSDGPQQSMVQPNLGKRPYDFDSKGPVDVYEDDEDFFDVYDSDFTDSDDIKDDDKINDITESVNKSLEMFRKFKNY